ncbi:gibberellin 2-beta-dioxygenase 8 isoform X2 [Daucus carota subsp. sativus]|uniref:gibberellin 2-beta-dioxygenase 8 isoform X2 n=1 Tax=Daucus carota subsp. sativus TaxID=79200 RepID=UPI0007EF8128|nr:PREDICTED: gibberellin 2-beta-dioxygenase 8 isoform X2 [Daucus carota subsp. sativus]
MEFEPPLIEVFKNLCKTSSENDHVAELINSSRSKSYELPLVDLGRLNSGQLMQQKECEKEIIEASKEWGFFQVVNHGICEEMLMELHEEQVKLFRQPFNKKSSQNPSNSPIGSYRWGNLAAKSPAQFSWSEAFHIPVSSVSDFAGLNHLRYPPIPEFHSEVCGLVAHTDTSYLTILHQNKTGGLEMKKDGMWISVKPNPDALVINIGDLFQVLSNGFYKSVTHRVLTNSKTERFSVAYLSCPTTDTVIRSLSEHSIYRDFSFGEFKSQVQLDVKYTGNKIGLPGFLR